MKNSIDLDDLSPAVLLNSYASDFESIPEQETAQIKEIVDLTLQLLKKRYGDDVGRRGVHPKAHGCVEARFTVNRDIPVGLRVGIFAEPGKEYKALVRLSNATALIQNDVDDKGAASSRGFALKLLDVEGETLGGQKGKKEQDFLLINQPMFAFSDVEEYLELTKIQLSNNEDITPFLALPGVFQKKGPILQRIATAKLGNPLEAQYFSASPFLFGRHMAVKFSVKPRNPGSTPIPEPPTPNYLSEALAASMKAPEASFIFDFMIQVRAGDLPIEDASAEWPESVAPFQNVATIEIKGPQDIDDPARVEECEHLVFSPWHCLTEHQPLGGINRLRLSVYKASARFRLK